MIRSIAGKSSVYKIYAIILIEGFVTISLEVQLIRQLLPYVGGSVIVTSLIIGTFLLFLAAGYKRGSQITSNFEHILKRNLSIALVLTSIGMSTMFTNKYFMTLIIIQHIHPIAPLIGFLFVIVAPLVYFLGQTIPITMNLLPRSVLVGRTGGHALALSTIGSFLGATITSTIIMTYLGVAMNIWINCLLLAFLTLILVPTLRRGKIQILFVIIMVFLSYTLSVKVESRAYDKTTSYASYLIANDFSNPDTKNLIINLSNSSSLTKDKKGYAYIEMIKKILFHDMHIQGKDILVLGAGGFTLSAESTWGNQFYYVNIDGQLPNIVVPKFTNKINGSFIGRDAREYLASTDKAFSVIVTDAYNSRLQIPAHLLTREFFESVANHLTPDGIAIFNIISNPTLSTSYSKRVDNTLRSTFGNCMSLPFTYSDAMTNILYICNRNQKSDDMLVYSDNINNSSMNFFTQ